MQEYGPILEPESSANRKNVFVLLNIFEKRYEFCFLG